tara:strand:+ start:237 stop:1148 length:912 start_codon:yes stop_codon:yes gene_type:complete
LKKNILVVGDSIIDHDIFCECVGTSLETPTLKAKFINEKSSFGGAANVVNNLLSLGARVTFFTGVGNDQYSGLFYNWKHRDLLFKPLKYEGQNLVKSRTWITKGAHSYKYLQINRGDKISPSETDIDTIKRHSLKQKFDTALLIDYRNGIFDDENTSQELIKHFKDNGTTVISSSQTSDRESRHSHFINSNFICMNQEEATHNSLSFRPTLEHMKGLSKSFNSNICVTLGARGSIMYYDGALIHHDGYKVDAVDSCGAGDSFLAAFGINYDDKNLSYCNKWAAASTLKRGTTVPSCEKLNDIV